MKKTTKNKKSIKKTTNKNVDVMSVSKQSVTKDAEKKLKNKGLKNKGLSSNNKLVIKISSLVTIVVLVLLAIGLYFFLDPKNSAEEEDPYLVYRGYEFERIVMSPELTVWGAKIKTIEGEERVQFRNHPLDLEGFSYDSDVNQYLALSQMARGEVTVTYSEEALNMGSGYVSLAGYELIRILTGALGFKVNVATMVEMESVKDFGVATCDDAELRNFVIEINQGAPRIEAEEFCAKIFFEEPEDSLKLAGLFVYKALGVMD